MWLSIIVAEIRVMKTAPSFVQIYQRITNINVIVGSYGAEYIVTVRNDIYRENLK